MAHEGERTVGLIVDRILDIIEKPAPSEAPSNLAVMGRYVFSPDIFDALEQVKPGKIDWPAIQVRLRGQGIVLIGGGADEAPEVYKRLPDVLAAHAGSIRVTHTLRPLGVAMAGRDVYDPYKD